MKKVIVGCLVGSIGLGGCVMGERGAPLTDSEKGALIGAAGGAVLGAVAYGGNRSKGALIGVIGGGLAGSAVGAYMDNQRRDLQKYLAPEISAGQARVERLANDVLRITMTSQTAFDTNSTQIKPGFHSTMDKVAEVLVRYGKTTLTVAGHTDNVGTAQYNQQLSERRALSVAQYLESRHVNPVRLSTVGKGESFPIESNATEAGRQANRRVEIYVQPVVDNS
jgi:outer membrane protein OmpA-like peptidoglycan-associated protein